MVLNTSFNLAAMPIVESPDDALSCFLDASDDLSLLVIGNRMLRKRPFPEQFAERVPVQQSSFVSRCVADQYGESRRTEVLVNDLWIELRDTLELTVLELCTGEMSSAELADELVAQNEQLEEAFGGVAQVAKEVETRLRHLYELRLISMEE